MIHNRVIVFFQPTGGTAADTVVAANQQVFIDLTAGTMSAAQTNATGLLVTGTGTAVPLDDSRTYSIAVLPSPSSTPPAASFRTTVRVAAGRVSVAPQIAIRVTSASGAATGGLRCTLTIGTTDNSVVSGPTGWIISNDQTSGAVSLTSTTNLLRTSSGTSPTVTLTLASTTVVRGASARINVSAGRPAPVGFRVTEWNYALSHTNPNGSAVGGTVTRPATEAASTFSDFWEGTMSASGTVTARFVSGVTLRAAGGVAISATVVAADPGTATLAVRVDPRPSFITTLTQNPEGTFTRIINTFHDTGHHDWTAPASSATASPPIGAGPNRGCLFVASISGVAFTSDPKINADVVNLSSAFQSAQGSVRVTAPPAFRGRIIPASMVTIAPNGTIIATTGPAIAALLGINSPAVAATVRLENTISAAELLTGTRKHEHLGPVSHKQNCLRALRALEPAVFIEAFVQGPTGAALSFQALLQARMQLVVSAAPIHNEVDEAATRNAGALHFVAGSTIPNVNVNSSGRTLTVWNPGTNSPLR